MRDVANRAFKTFIEVFITTAIPNVVILLQNYEAYSWDKWYVYAIQIGLPALGTAISAAWNGIENYLTAKKAAEEDE